MSLIVPNRSEASKPLFDGEFIAFSEFDRHALRELIRAVGSKPKRILEIGSWLGNGSTRTIIEELVQEGAGALYCVDTWKGNINVRRHQDIVASHDVYGTFMRNVRQAGGEGLVRPLVMNSADAAANLSNHTFDLIFIDADHSYEATSEDIRLWRSKVRPGGILCGHDCEQRVSDVGMAVLQAHKKDDTIPGNDKFTHLHPGVILATYEAFGDNYHLWGEHVVELENGARGRPTLWDVRL